MLLSKSVSIILYGSRFPQGPKIHVEMHRYIDITLNMFILCAISGDNGCDIIVPAYQYGGWSGVMYKPEDNIYID